KKLLIKKIMDNGVKVHTGFKLSRVLDNGVVVEDRNAEERFIEADAVVIAVGSRPDDRLYLQIKDLGYEIHQIGDCLEPRSAKSAIYEGAVLGRSI
ncbi:MAG: FAD-dependent oxidoreductase, partial [Candidatus Desulfacyla sp.]